MKYLLFGLSTCLGGAVAAADERAVFVEPPLDAPRPIAVTLLPPPLRSEAPPPAPAVGMAWVGGYWIWADGAWAWMTGHWAAAPAGFVWAAPYYENRFGLVIFVPGHWRKNGTDWSPPPLASVVVAQAREGYDGARAPRGQDGAFVPAPPGSLPGITIPAPVGTSPQVVAGAPPVVQTGMRVERATDANVTIVAPARVTKSDESVQLSAPSNPALAAAQTPKEAVAPPALPPEAIAGREKLVSASALAAIAKPVPPPAPKTPPARATPHPAARQVAGPARGLVKIAKKKTTSRVAQARAQVAKKKSAKRSKKT